MFIFELRWLLFLLILLPLLSMVVTVGIIYWLDRRWQTRDMLATLQPLLDQAPIGLLVVQKNPPHFYANRYAQQLFGPELLGADMMPSLLAFLERVEHRYAGISDTVGIYQPLELDADIYQDFYNDFNPRLRWWVTTWEKTSFVFCLDTSEEQQIEQKFDLMLGRLSHELRTPLETIATHLEVMRLPHISDEQKVQSVTYAKQETQRLARLSNRALELVQLHNHPFIETALVDLPDLVDEVVKQLTNMAQAKQIRLRTDIDRPLPAVIGNAELLKQVFINLLTNSIDHGRSEDTVTISLRREASSVVCIIQDDGPGIAAKHLPHLTEPFYRVVATDFQHSAQNTGLGLAIVAEILQRHRSHLTIESISGNEAAPGEKSGTSIRFALPVAAKSQP